MALAYTAAIQDRVFRTLGIDLATADTDTKTFIDNVWTSGSLTGGVALDALTQIQQQSQWFALLAPTSAPVEWESWLVAKTVLICASKFQPDRYQAYQEVDARAELAAVDAFARNLITYDPGATPEASVLTVQNVRYYVVAHLVRRDPGWQTINGSPRQRPRKFIPFEVIDSQLERIMRRIWQYGDWPFAKRDITLSIDTSSNVTVNGLTGETFASLCSRRLYFNDASSLGANYMEWFKDADDQSRRLAYDANSGVTARPQLFSFSDKAGTLTWKFSPPPDQAYICNTICLVKGPTLATLSDTTTALARFPAEFNHVIKDAVLAEVLRHIGDPAGEKLWEQVQEEIERMLPVYCDPGAPDNESLETRDVYGDTRQFTGGSSTMGGWM